MNTTRGKDGAASPKGKASTRRKPVYRSSNPDLQAECIYFYHLTASSNYPDRYFVDLKRPILRSEMPEQMALIMDDIKSGALQPITSPKLWERKSYFAAVLDIANSELDEGNAVRFSWEGIFRGNHTFRDGEDVRPLREPHSGLTGFFCLNHMRHKLGHVLRQGDREKFTIHFNHPHAILHRAMLGHEDSGTNLGPPIPPPPP